MKTYEKGKGTKYQKGLLYIRYLGTASLVGTKNPKQGIEPTPCSQGVNASCLDKHLMEFSKMSKD